MTLHDSRPSACGDLFLHDSILHDASGGGDPVGADGEPLDVLHDREYRVRAFRKADDVILIRGAVRDQKPPGLYFADDPEPLTIHHMQVDIEVRLPMMEIIAASVEFRTHPNETCPVIVEHYDNLVGLSIARGFTHRVRDLFGGPRGCTHTTALLQAMAPVAIQTIWSVAAADQQRAAEAESTEALDDDERAARRMAMWRTNLNSCHVWAEDSETVAALTRGELPDPPVFARERMVTLGLKPDDWARRFPG